MAADYRSKASKQKYNTTLHHNNS